MSPFHSTSENSPTIVCFGFIVEDLIEVDENNLAIEIEFKMAMRWADPRIKLTAFASNISAMTRGERAIVDTKTR